MRTTLALTLAFSSSVVGAAHASPPAHLTDGPLLSASAPVAARVRAELGWSTTTDEAVAELRTEARVWRGLSLFAGAQARRDDDGARPVLGAAYQLVADDARAVRVQVMYRPEGMVEPEGEVEAAVIGARAVAGGWATGALTYGQDPEGRERDVEALLGYRAGLGRSASLGALGRGRRALGDQLEHERVWDVLAGGVAAIHAGTWSVELLAGLERVGRQTGGQTGTLATLGVGATW